MNAISIRSLKHETASVMSRVALGESLEIRRRNQPVAILKPMESAQQVPARPDFRKRLEAVYGDLRLRQTATELLAEERGGR